MLEYDRIDISEGIMLVKQVCQKNAIFLAIGILKILVLSMNHTSLVTSALDTYLCNGCHDLMQKAMSFDSRCCLC